MAISFVGSTAWNAAAINGGSVTVTMSSLQAGDYVVAAVTIASTRTPTFSVLSSAGTAYTSLITVLNSSSLHFGVFGRLLTGAETSLTSSGTGNSSDSQSIVVLAFRGVDSSTPIDVSATSTTGSGTTPDSPSITVASNNCAIISAVGAQINDTTVTAPTSFLNQNDDTSNDTWDTTTGIAWITNASTAAFNPTSWTNFTSATWGSATVALRPFVAPFLWQDYTDTFPDYYRTTELVGY